MRIIPVGIISVMFVVVALSAPRSAAPHRKPALPSAHPSKAKRSRPDRSEPIAPVKQPVSADTSRASGYNSVLNEFLQSLPAATDDSCKEACTSHLFLATVPDPFESHYAYQFDRAIEAIQLALQDFGGYVPVRHWFPWSEERPTAHIEDAGERAEQIEANAALSHFPGIVIFRNVKQSGAAIMLFLLPETPSRGIALSPLDTALESLQNMQQTQKHPFWRSPSTPQSPILPLIGPTFSGSTGTLREALRRIKAKLPSVFVEVTTGTATALQPGGFDPERGKATQDSAETIVKTTIHDDSALRSALFCYLGNTRGRDNDRIAVVKEAGTVYGAEFTPRDLNDCTHIVTSNNGSRKAPTFFTFPRDLAQMRAAYQDDPETSLYHKARSPSATLPGLKLNIKDPANSDSLPVFAPGTTAVSQEATFLDVARSLKERWVEYTLLVSTNAMDSIVLGRLFRNSAPNSRLIFANADVLYQRKEPDSSFYGSLVLSTYPLFDRGTQWSLKENAKVLPKLPSEHATGIYNACLLTFKQNFANLLFNESVSSDINPPRAVGYGYYHWASATSPPLWMLAVGRDGGFWPIHVQEAATPGMRHEKDDSTRNIHLGRATKAWYGMLFSLLIASAWHAAYWTRLIKNSHLKRASWVLPLIIGALCLLTGLGVAMVFHWKWLEGFGGLELSICILLFFVAVVCTILPLRGVPWARVAAGTVFVVIAAVLISAVVVYAMWLMTAGPPRCNPDGVFLRFRALHPESGLTPITPLCVLLLIGYAGASLALKQRLADEEYGDGYLQLPGIAADDGLDRLLPAAVSVAAAASWSWLICRSFQSLETRAFDLLITIGLIVVWSSLVHAIATAAVVWRRLRAQLRILEVSEYRNAFNQLPKDAFSWTRMWDWRGNRDRNLIMRRSSEVYYKLTNVVEDRRKTLDASAASYIVEGCLSRAGHYGVPDNTTACVAEFVAMRYADHIENTLVRLRHLVLYGSIGFIFSVICIASYPFQPEQELTLVNTALFMLLSTVVVWILVGIDRDPLLSRLNDTTSQKLGFDFIWKAVTVVVPPLLFAVANQFPSAGRFLFSWVQPALEALR